MYVKRQLMIERNVGISIRDMWQHTNNVCDGLFAYFFILINLVRIVEWVVVDRVSAGAKPKESLLCNSTTDPPPDHIRITTRSPVNLDRKFNVPQVYGDTVFLGLGWPCLVSCELA